MPSDNKHSSNLPQEEVERLKAELDTRDSEALEVLRLSEALDDLNQKYNRLFESQSRLAQQVIDESNKNYDLGRRHRSEELAPEIERLRARIAQLEKVATIGARIINSGMSYIDQEEMRSALAALKGE